MEMIVVCMYSICMYVCVCVYLIYMCTYGYRQTFIRLYMYVFMYVILLSEFILSNYRVEIRKTQKMLLDIYSQQF